MADYYQILGVNVHSTLEEIKVAHRQLAKKYHPDINGPSTASAFIRVQSAYDWMINNHNPKPKPPTSEKNPKTVDTYYTMMNSRGKDFSHKIPFHQNIIPAQTRFRVMDMHDGLEFSVFFKEAKRLPLNLNVNLSESRKYTLLFTHQQYSTGL